MGGLGECADPMCCAHRLFRPLVRPQFRDFIVACIQQAMPQGAWLRYTSLGSGELLFDAELLEHIRRARMHIAQVCLIDREYRQPSMSTRRALREFADCQRAAAYLDQVRPAEVLAFGSVEDYYEAAAEEGRAARCHLFVHCDAHWDGALHDCDRLAAWALVPGGLLTRLHPQMSSMQVQVPGRHSPAAFSAAAWIRSPDILPDIGYSREISELAGNALPALVPFQFTSLQAFVESINAASSTPLRGEMLQAQREALKLAARRRETKREAAEWEQRKKNYKEAPEREEREAAEREQREAAERDREREQRKEKARKHVMEATRGKSFNFMGNVRPKVYLERTPVGLLYPGDEVVVSPEPELPDWEADLLAGH